MKTETGLICYTPEMGEKNPNCQLEARLSYNGKHYIVNTPLELKGRGITPLEVNWIKVWREKDIEDWKSYKVTKKAFEKLKEQYSISMALLLD